VRHLSRSLSLRVVHDAAETTPHILQQHNAQSHLNVYHPFISFVTEPGHQGRHCCGHPASIPASELAASASPMRSGGGAPASCIYTHKSAINHTLSPHAPILTFCIFSTINSLSSAFPSLYPSLSNLPTISLTNPLCTSYLSLSSTFKTPLFSTNHPGNF